MDSLITAAARALAQGDPLGALQRVALRDDAPALAMRGIAMAQLMDFSRARVLLRRAARSFGAREPVARARCVVAEAEVALASRDLSWPTKALAAATATLHDHGDFNNAAHARQLAVGRLLLLGRLDEAEACLGAFDPPRLPAALRAAHELLRFGIAVRRLRVESAQESLVRARRAASQSRIPALLAEANNASQILRAPAAQLTVGGRSRPLRLGEVAKLFASARLVVDESRFAVRCGVTISLARRPVLFALALELAQAWPNDASRIDLIARVFRTQRADDSHRVRLRVEMGRLRAALKQIASIDATKIGFVLKPRRSQHVVVLRSLLPGEHAPVIALLADGEAWSSSAVAIALGMSQRSAQRALEALAAGGKVQCLGQGRARRWITPAPPGFATTLLLPAPLPAG